MFYTATLFLFVTLFIFFEAKEEGVETLPMALAFFTLSIFTTFTFIEVILR